MKEIKHFEPMLKVGGIMIFHDLVNKFYTNINDIIEAITAGKHISDCPVAIVASQIIESANHES